MKTRLTFAIILTCCITISCEKQAKETVPPHHHLGYSEFLSDSLKITAYPDRNIIMLALLADKTKRNSYQEEHLLAYWGYNGEAYNLPLYRSLTDFSDVKLSAVFPKSEDISVRYWTSCISGAVTITSEQSLFGETPGKDISDHFTRCTQYGLSWDYLYKINMLKSSDFSIAIPRNEEKPVTAADFFYPGHVLMTWQSSSSVLYDYFETGYAFVLKENPTEACNSSVITICIPIEDTFYLDAFDMSGNLDESKIKHSERVLKGTVELHFN